MTTGSFTIHPQAVSETTGSVSSLLQRGGELIGELESAVLDGSAFATLGGDVAAANSAMQSKQVGALQRLRSLLDEINRLVGTSNSGYQQADESVATAYGADTNATTTAAAATGTGGTDLAHDQALRDQLAQDEGSYTHVYVDTMHHPTVGIGFNLDRNDARERLTAVGADYDAVRAGTQDLTPDQVNQLFSHDVSGAVDTARNYFNGFDQLDVARQRVLTNMAFTMGGPTLGQFHGLHTALVNGDYNSAASHMLNSAWAGQVGARATRLADHMRTGQ